MTTTAIATTPFLDLCAKRQSCRSYTGQRIDHDTLLQVVEAARLAPSACNSQPWKFILVESPEQIKKTAKLGQPEGMNGFLTDCGAILLIVETKAHLMPGLEGRIDEQKFAFGDVGCAAMSATLAAAEAGLGSCIIGMYDNSEVVNALNLPPDTKITYYIALGYPKSDLIRKKQRHELDDILTVI
ncbi:NAD(P)H nitroreductase [Clostridia bacterium]|nr:NAD(P)H nitroreductase [Clostridia bacterium]